MSRTFTVAQLRARAQVLADDENAVLASNAQYDVWIGESYAWLWDLLVASGIYPALSTHTLVADGVAATGYLTIWGTTGLNNQTVTIGSVTYTFKGSVGATANEVLRDGSDPRVSVANLVAAINLAAGSGSLYGSSTVVHPTVSAAISEFSPLVVKVTARTAGVAGNAIATTDTVTDGQWDEATLSGGLDTAGSNNYALATDNYAVLAVQYQQGDVWIPLEPLCVSDWHRYDTGETGIAHKYLVHGAEGTTQRIRLLPTPETGGVYRVLYVPRPASSLSDSSTIDGVSGWEQLIAIDVAIKARLREESSVTDLGRERQILIDRIDRMKFERSLGQLRMPDTGDAFFDAASVGRMRRPW